MLSHHEISALILVRNAPYQATNAADLEELATKGMIQWVQRGITRRRPCLTALGERFYSMVVAASGARPTGWPAGPTPSMSKARR